MRKTNIWLLATVILLFTILVSGCGNKQWQYNYEPGKVYKYRADFDVEGSIDTMIFSFPLTGKDSSEYTFTASKTDEEGITELDISYTSEIKMNDPLGQEEDYVTKDTVNMIAVVGPKGDFKIKELHSESGNELKPGELEDVFKRNFTAGFNYGFLGPPLPETPPQEGESWTFTYTIPLVDGKEIELESRNTYLGDKKIDGKDYTVIKSTFDKRLNKEDFLNKEELSKFPPGQNITINLNGEIVNYIAKKDFLLEWAEENIIMTGKLTAVEPKFDMPVTFNIELEFKGKTKRVEVTNNS